mgnify:CR=1 FL=1
MELNQTSIRYYDKRFSRLSTSSETADAIVPDTFPDIGRVVCAYGMAAVRDQSPQSGRLLISGMVQTVVLYEPEKGDGLRRLTIPVSFAHIEECDGMDAETVCMVSCKVASVEAVAVNSRKLSIKVQLRLAVDGYCVTVCEITEGMDDPSVELLCENVNVTLTEQVCTSPITILDDIAVQQAEDMALLHAGCTLRPGECRAMRGKVVIKGEAVVQCLALQQDGAVRVLSGTTPFTQIAELAEADEGDQIDIQLTVREMDCHVEQEGVLSYTVSASALISIRRTHTLRRICDLYVPGKTLQMSEQQIVLHSTPPYVPFSAETSETLATPQHVSHVVAAEAVCCGVKRGTENEVQVTAAIQALYLSDDQKLHAVDCLLPMTMSCAAAGEISSVALSVRAAAAGETGLLMQLTATGMASAESRAAFRHITQLEEEEPKEKTDAATLLLRYIEEEQQLWDIAKQCGTTAEAIRQANDLPADAAQVAHTVLLIPIQI